MNTEELNFAYKVRHALNETLDDLPPATTDRLVKARQMALARKKPDGAARRTAPVVRSELAGVQGGNWSFSWFNRMGVALPLLVLVAGLIGIYQYEQQEHIAEIAELDAAVLSDELPLSAYLDHGFNAYLNQSEQ